MAKYQKINIILKDDPRHDMDNERIMDYLNDRHQILNDCQYVINLTILDQSNIDDFAKKDLETIPAMAVDGDDYVYGVNSIIAELAQLECKQQIIQAKNKIALKDNTIDIRASKSIDEMIENEINNKDLQDEDETQGATGSGYHKSKGASESVLTEAEIAAKTDRYADIYKSPSDTAAPPRRPSSGKPVNSRTTSKLSNDDVDDMVANSGFDKMEQMLMSSLINND
jgi:hypothetical protein